MQRRCFISCLGLNYCKNHAFKQSVAPIWKLFFANTILFEFIFENIIESVHTVQTFFDIICVKNKSQIKIILNTWANSSFFTLHFSLSLIPFDQQKFTSWKWTQNFKKKWKRHDKKRLKNTCQLNHMKFLEWKWNNWLTSNISKLKLMVIAFRIWEISDLLWF